MNNDQQMNETHGAAEAESSSAKACLQWQPVTLVFPGCRDRKLQVFENEHSARKHMEKHLLSFGEGSSKDASESRAWMLVIPRLAQWCKDLADARQREQAYWRWRRDSQAFIACYRLYAQSIQLNVSDACQLDWKWVGPRRGGGWEGVALGTSGVLVVAENGVVRTAFLPNQHTNGCYLDSNGELQARPSQRRMRAGGKNFREQKQHKKRRESWPPEKLLYYDVFRPAVQFIRRAQHETFSRQGDLRPRDNIYHHLKDKLPTCKSLRYENWCLLRHRVRKKLYDHQVN